MVNYGLLILIIGFSIIIIGYSSVKIILETLQQPSPIMNLPIFAGFLGVPVFLFFGVLVSLIGYGLTMYHIRNKIPYPLLVAFLGYGIAVGLSAVFLANMESYVFLNPVGYEISTYTYNKVLIPYWEDSLTPVSYQTTPIIILETGKITGYEKNPVYDFPIESAKALIFPITLLVWGAVGGLMEIMWKMNRK